MSEVTNNRLGNVSNYYQCGNKKVLCVCSAGLLRSPTLALVLSMPPFNFNTRAVGVSKDFALIPIDAVHVAWADDIICFSEGQKNIIEEIQTELREKHNRGFYNFDKAKVHMWDIEDIFEYRNPILMEAMTLMALDEFKDDIKEK